MVRSWFLIPGIRGSFVVLFHIKDNPVPAIAAHQGTVDVQQYLLPRAQLAAAVRTCIIDAALFLPNIIFHGCSLV